MGTLENGLKVLMLPWLAHGHISSFLQLAKKLSKRNIFVYLCSTPINLLSLPTKNLSQSIQLVEIHIPTLPNLPPHYHTTNGLPPHLMDTLKQAFQMSKPQILSILCHLKPDLLIHDASIMWVGEVSWSTGIPAIDFLTFGAAFSSYYMTMIPLAHRGLDFPFPHIHLEEYEKSKIIPQLKVAAGDDDLDRVNPSRICNLRLIKSSKEIEGKYIDYFKSISKRQVIPVGLLTDQEPLVDDHDHDSLGLVPWLNKKDKASCIFVSFGSEYFLTNEEIEEIAHGLEISNVNFIWVIRISKENGAKIEDLLPKGFVERVGERGNIVEGWAPQAMILRHRGIGGFMSHCGWNSVLESMTFGVPIIAMPVQLDQPLNARLVVEFGVGMEISREAGSGRVTREVVAKVVREVVVEKGGEGVRRRAVEISSELSTKGEEEIDELIKQLIHINEERIRTMSNLLSFGTF